ncbi:HEAT repeat-containing protein 4 [Anguilla rostrata]|uniref:HEAT repeat-containing protein 4 n=1 Tax=Anguilla rostrata TaxID=7938 RepID=UPI0030D0ED5C
MTSAPIKYTETPLQFRDCLSPHTSNYVSQTENSSQQLPIAGILLPELRGSTKKQNGVTVDSDAQHQKHRQQGFPCGTEKGTELPEAGVVPRVQVGDSTNNCAAEMSSRTPDGSRMDRRLPHVKIIGLLWQPPGHNPTVDLSLLRCAVEEWIITLKIETSWLNITTEGLKKAFSDPDHNVRLEAIATCALRAVYGARVDQDPPSTVDHVLQPLLLSALDDDHVWVQMAAAVCQYAMGMPSLQAREILQSTLQRGADADIWLAAQCLAAGGGTSLPVIQVLLSRLFGSEVQREQEQATALLANISSKTTLVRTLLAKELNCANWRNRVLACKTIAQLKGPINKDLVNKLTQLMWKDCHSEARQAAAQTLGALGRGRELHNELRVQLEEGPSLLRVEALVLLAQLKIMTPRLLPSFLSCLRDDFAAVRKQACLTAAALCTKDQAIVNQLIELSQDDPVWGVKVAAIDALGEIGCLTPPLQKILLLAIQCEKEPEVRIAACEAIRILRVDVPELQPLLQQRLLLENHPQVHRHIESLMKSYGFPIEGDENLVLKIKDQVQKLCSKRIITGKVLLLEELHDSQQQQKRFLGHSAQPDSPPQSMTQLLQARCRELNHTSSAATISRATDNNAGIQVCLGPGFCHSHRVF